MDKQHKKKFGKQPFAGSGDCSRSSGFLLSVPLRGNLPDESQSCSGRHSAALMGLLSRSGRSDGSRDVTAADALMGSDVRSWFSLPSNGTNINTGTADGR